MVSESSSSNLSILKDQVSLEQINVDLIFEEFDGRLKRTYDKMDKIVHTEYPTETEKTDLIAQFEQEYRRLGAAENKLIFGKMLFDQVRENETYYIGRTGLQNDNKHLLIDWRSKVGGVFYCATTTKNEGVILRRHIGLDVRDVVSVDDEVLQDDKVDQNSIVVGDGALIHALNSRRSKHMNDIVATIQNEQDKIIRAPFSGTSIIQGTPGTGKTAVALHRIAFLLYNNPTEFANNGALFVGPNRRFLDYVSQVLPSLGESGVIQSTIPGLTPEVNVTRNAQYDEIRIKGDIRMEKVLKSALEQYKTFPIDVLDVMVDTMTFQITKKMTSECFALVEQRSDELFENNEGDDSYDPKTFNAQRKMFINILANKLVEQNTLISQNPDAKKSLKSKIMMSESFNLIVNTLWVPVDPITLISQLMLNKKRLASAFGGVFDGILEVAYIDYLLELSDELRDEIGNYRFSDADCALVDCAKYLIEGKKIVRTSLNEDLIDEAKDILKNVAWTAEGKIDAQTLAGRFNNIEIEGSSNFKTYAHICVDEAQELSPMEWRMLNRRSLYDSWTIVGDIFQTYSPAGVKDWNELKNFLGEVRIDELRVNYRNPAQIAQYANDVAQEQGMRVPENIEYPRSIDGSVIQKQLSEPEIIALAQELGETGLTAIIADSSSALFENVTAASPQQFDVLTPEQSKGLEFDNVIVVNPAEITSQPSGVTNLFVAMTRATQKLIVVHTTRTRPPSS
jgi:DNA helicase IV